jgi:hypothetical protein
MSLSRRRYWYCRQYRLLRFPYSLGQTQTIVAGVTACELTGALTDYLALAPASQFFQDCRGLDFRGGAVLTPPRRAVGEKLAP